MMYARTNDRVSTLAVSHLCERPVIIGHAQQARRCLMHFVVLWCNLERRECVRIRLRVALGGRIELRLAVGNYRC